MSLITSSYIIVVHSYHVLIWTYVCLCFSSLLSLIFITHLRWKWKTKSASTRRIIINGSACARSWSEGTDKGRRPALASGCAAVNSQPVSCLVSRRCYLYYTLIHTHIHTQIIVRLYWNNDFRKSLYMVVPFLSFFLMTNEWVCTLDSFFG